MDFNSLKDQVSNLTLYDLKAGFRKAQNAVMNFTEMEAKVREATNNEPWGASSTLMQEIANATFNYQLLNEIMPMIYKRFTEKASEEWRQIYKALQLLEFLIKNGSERVIDDARSHVSLLKMLRQFHFIDQNGKDQGINVRNRAKELADLLADVDRIRQERKKARANRNKFGGVEGGMGLGGGFSGSGGSSRYGGFGSESAEYGGHTGGVYGDGGGFGGQDASFNETQQRRERFDEYDEYDEGETAASPARRKEPAASSTRREGKKAEPPKPKEPEPVVDLLAWDDEPAPAASSSSGKQPADDDDFDDFQSAAPAPAAKPAGFGMAPPASTSTIGSTTQFAAPQPQSAAQNSNLNDLFATVSPAPAANRIVSPPAQPASMASGLSQPPKSTGYQATGPNYFTSVPQPALQSGVSTPGSVKSPGGIGGGAPKKAGGDAFASLLGGVSKKPQTPTQKVTMGDLAKQKTSQGLWGAPGSSSSTPAAQSPQSGSKPAGGALGDLLG
ncbi:ENTH-domain-containing protein [Didymella exigua CBS 183.55]|uniref:ENTH-domain-containing protein n=1 Tax=Didymella exigua CBS 183.55 TaxID=1150837 RepID=A0A6A5RQA3_9PLEO|nr:ENTH-domain-containing protein [Didymella exigua CBS 183.55]KAF1930621.1 ENTH-domain-containing protein [Didymella exigua CBS 183.55]